MTALLDRETRWSCPNCNDTAVTYRLNEQKFHHCRGLFSLWAPMVEDGIRCKITARDRDDYVGDEDVQLDGRGRPVMAVDVLRDEGNDVVIYAPCAHADLKELE